MSDATAKNVVMTCISTYRQTMAELSQLNTLEVWYQAMYLDQMVAAIKDPAIRRRGLQRTQKESQRSIAEDIFPKLAEHRGELQVIKDQLPTIFHIKGYPPGEIKKEVKDALARYRNTLHSAQQALLDRYELHDATIKVVGIGSVGTACWVLLFMAGPGDPLFLQVKEARASVLERYAGKSVFENHGQRVLDGFRLMQPASDMFLGWTYSVRGKHFYVRQLRDIKITAKVETFGVPEMTIYATWCGRALALAHAGSSIMLSGYMGKSDTFDKAIADFSVVYADQNEKDHDALDRAVRSGKVKADVEEQK